MCFSYPHPPVFVSGVADIVRPEFEGVATAAGNAAEGVAGEGVVASVLVGVKLESNGVCEGRQFYARFRESYSTGPP